MTQRAPCRGGCGSAVPEGQACVACATRAVQEWKAAKHAADIWEARNADNFHAHHSELHRMEVLRDRLTWLIEQRGPNGHFSQQEDEMAALALIDFIRLLPYMWD